jgi:hypothetical protein
MLPKRSAPLMLQKYPDHEGDLSEQCPTFAGGIPKIINIMPLQKNLGNQAIQGMLETKAIQAKLTIGQPNDIYEQEAGRMADQVMRMPKSKQPLVNVPSTLVYWETACPECEEEEEHIQTKPMAEQITPIVQRKNTCPECTEEELTQSKGDGINLSGVSSGMESGIESLKGGGQPLSESSRSFFEPRFGADFSQVRVHTDTRAAEAAQSVNARAFTMQNAIVFNHNQYSTETTPGKQLLAHELTHVVQQGYHSSIVQKQETDAKCSDTTCHATAKEAANDVDQHVVPSDCFVWEVGRDQCPIGCGRWKAIQGTGCAHWVAHQMNIENGPTCNAGKSIRVKNVVEGRTSNTLEEAEVDDIWTNNELKHTGIVREVKANDDGKVTDALVEHDSSRQGGVVTDHFSSGLFWRKKKNGELKKDDELKAKEEK